MIFAFQDSTRNLHDMFRSFAGAENHFGKTFSEGAMSIHLSEREFCHRRGLESAQHCVCIQRTVSKLIEEIPPFLRRHRVDFAYTCVWNKTFR